MVRGVFVYSLQWRKLPLNTVKWPARMQPPVGLSAETAFLMLVDRPFHLSRTLLKCYGHVSERARLRLSSLEPG